MNENLRVLPDDKYNEELVENTHPQNWVNPEPSPMYNLVVIGGGTAGLVSAAGAAGLGAKVALIEKHLLGGDCLNYGCVPSKCVIRSSKAYADIRNASSFGFGVPKNMDVDFSAVMERMRKLRARISYHDSAKRFRELGVDVFIGEGRFSSKESIEVDGKTLKFKKAVIATGARATVPPIDGLENAGYLTNETVFSLTERPKRLAVIGGGPLGCELAQAFQRLGSQVIVMDRNNHILKREDEDAAEILQKAFIDEGISLVLNCAIKKVESSNGEKVIHYESSGKEETAIIDEILVGSGRTPNVENMNLETAGVEFDAKGVKVDDHLCTTNPKIYAAGDISMNHKFTHTADAAARIVIQNALFLGRKKLSALTVPWCTYTDPEIAHVGMYEHEAKEKGIDVDTVLEGRPSWTETPNVDQRAYGWVKST